jgi:chromosome segregation ATPase
MRNWTWIGSALVLATLYGCNGDAQRDAKREQDRAEMKLEDAERQRDANEAQIDQLKVQLDAATKDDQQAKADLDDKSAKLQKATDDLAAAQSNQSTASDEATKKLVESNNALRTQLLDLQTKEMQATDESVKLTQEITELREQLASKGTTAATTEPAK